MTKDEKVLLENEFNKLHTRFDAINNRLDGMIDRLEMMNKLFANSTRSRIPVPATKTPGTLVFTLFGVLIILGLEIARAFGAMAF